MKTISYECVGLSVAMILTDKQIRALATAVKFLMNKGYDLDELLTKITAPQTPLSFDLCDVIHMIQALVATIDSFELNDEDTKALHNAYRMHYILNKIRYELEYGGN